jgi:hypothetical protein
LPVFLKILFHILVPLRRLRSQEIQRENNISRLSSWCLYRGEGSESKETGDKGGTRVCCRDRFESLLKGLAVSVWQRWVGWWVPLWPWLRDGRILGGWRLFSFQRLVCTLSKRV